MLSFFMLQYKYAYNELEKRISEHDTALGDGFDKPQLTIQVSWFKFYFCTEK